MSKDCIIKYVIIGWCGIGKTSMAEYYINNKEVNNERIVTIGIEFYSKNIICKNHNLSLQIWDTAGQEKYRSVVKYYYRDSYGAFLCFSITNRYSFDLLKYYIDELNLVNENNVTIILVGTFEDMSKKRIVSYDEAINFAEKYGLDYIEVSSKTGKNIEYCFNKMNEKMCEKIDCMDPAIVADNPPLHCGNDLLSESIMNEYILKCCR